ncbi:hypothetical protein H5410_010738 [Solanum commersonii]|uniref:Late embryogenesis abundant protein LEA-2 subgroup domain-containing protein n=1 Tax=Solanum commersonii TaxID=4109 RepID=A0A9J6ALI9_SOLCO|nr:hypothetical protein H5410_010738 [Solanum commersonii]
MVSMAPAIILNITLIPLLLHHLKLHLKVVVVVYFYSFPSYFSSFSLSYLLLYLPLSLKNPSSIFNKWVFNTLELHLTQLRLPLPPPLFHSIFEWFSLLSMIIRLGSSTVSPGFTIMYRGIPLGRGSVPAFYQPAHSIKRVETTIVVDRVNLLQADATDLIRDAALNDRVELRVLGDVGAKIRILGFTSPGVEVSVDCAIVISPRKQALTYKQCGFDGLSV